MLDESNPDEATDESGGKVVVSGAKGGEMFTSALVISKIFKPI